MLHAKFQDPRPFGSGEEKFKGFLLISPCGHVAWTIYINFSSSAP